MEGDLKTDIITVTHHILSQQQHIKEASGDLSIILTSIGTACKWITNVVRKAELLKVIGVTGTTNVQQENVQKLDILSNEIMINLLRDCKKTALLVSEENDEAIHITGENRGHYCVVFDPLDGSSNIDCGVSVGTIFGIYKLNTLSDKPLLEQVLVPGTEMICGGKILNLFILGYCMYGSCSVLVMAIGGQIKLGKKKIYSLNEGYAHSFHPAVKGYLDSLKFPPANHTGKFTPYSARYVGSMVADVTIETR
ncbi:Fructose-1,6-bisphosphatase [Globomyces sp. JEL0801]|nr:Fructose-1,6-bisphosphatase [Globomyces sp. JEL0801]